MSWATVAVAGATAVSGVMASRSADKASKRASRASEAELAFAREQYADWKATYGPIQENLSAYYSNLTPEYYESIGLEAVAKEQAETSEQIQATLAQRGITDSGVAASLDAQLEMDAARQRASVRQDAPRSMMQDQQNFLAIGQGVNPASNVQGALANQSARTAATSASAQRAAGQAWGAAIPAIGQAVTGISNYNKAGG